MTESSIDVDGTELAEIQAALDRSAARRVRLERQIGGVIQRTEVEIERLDAAIANVAAERERLERSANEERERLASLRRRVAEIDAIFLRQPEERDRLERRKEEQWGEVERVRSELTRSERAIERGTEELTRLQRHSERERERLQRELEAEQAAVSAATTERLDIENRAAANLARLDELLRQLARVELAAAFRTSQLERLYPQTGGGEASSYLEGWAEDAARSGEALRRQVAEERGRLGELRAVAERAERARDAAVARWEQLSQAAQSIPERIAREIAQTEGMIEGSMWLRHRLARSVTEEEQRFQEIGREIVALELRARDLAAERERADREIAEQAELNRIASEIVRAEAAIVGGVDERDRLKRLIAQVAAARRGLPVAVGAIEDKAAGSAE